MNSFINNYQRVKKKTRNGDCMVFTTAGVAFVTLAGERLALVILHKTSDSVNSWGLVFLCLP